MRYKPYTNTAQIHSTNTWHSWNKFDYITEEDVRNEYTFVKEVVEKEKKASPSKINIQQVTARWLAKHFQITFPILNLSFIFQCRNKNMREVQANPSLFLRKILKFRITFCFRVLSLMYHSSLRHVLQNRLTHMPTVTRVILRFCAYKLTKDIWLNFQFEGFVLYFILKQN